MHTSLIRKHSHRIHYLLVFELYTNYFPFCKFYFVYKLTELFSPCFYWLHRVIPALIHTIYRVIHKVIHIFHTLFVYNLPTYPQINFIEIFFTYFLFLFILIQITNIKRQEVMMMKIEKLNDNQIRCTLTRADLASRELKLSELICGSEKAKSLFQDMMKQAASEFGFEAEDMPLMIEAIPSSSDSIVLIITKVDNPEELDSKFSKFGASLNEMENKKAHRSGLDKTILDKLEGADQLFDFLQKLKKSISDIDSETDIPFGPMIEDKEREGESELDSKTAKVRLFSFSSLDNAIRACQLIKPMYHGANTLYKDTDNSADKNFVENSNVYILALSQSEHTPDEFFRICNMMSEYGSNERVSPAMLAFLEEHCEIIVSAEAVQQLGSL